MFWRAVLVLACCMMSYDTLDNGVGKTGFITIAEVSSYDGFIPASHHFDSQIVITRTADYCILVLTVKWLISTRTFPPQRRSLIYSTNALQVEPWNSRYATRPSIATRTPFKAQQVTRMATQITDVPQPQVISVKALQQIFSICKSVACSSPKYRLADDTIIRRCCQLKGFVTTL